MSAIDDDDDDDKGRQHKINLQIIFGHLIIYMKGSYYSRLVDREHDFPSKYLFCKTLYDFLKLSLPKHNPGRRFGDYFDFQQRFFCLQQAIL